ncbi:MAG: gamma carbonic anhydrase family protein [Deltaproteobacteria bacterium CG2_30_63_29]|nr:MAG: gamma carbonic anhydrase family protein [Deltaproteobacteria bacterium CG2_30_63_29]PIW00110.1 MAG: gamma carbonic anhydrase family protein [Deltaproteobacteria bacterium CG17_big_fil_post_rev_8_21_14_2_50_63_7]PJB41795.1 MAG: gamma carbonic anhydrase family protein [Deltaproteobacteria bacterium CG_4_9_14_3_um_filter_63_12]
MIYAYRQHWPVVPVSVYLAPGSAVIGDVELGAGCSCWFNCVIRGDVHFIRIGALSNIQDNAVVHVTRDKYATHIGERVTIGHSAIIHGCTIGDSCMIGMGAIVMDRAIIEPNSMVAAGAVVTPGTVIPSGMLAVGSPARASRPLRDNERQHIEELASNYHQLAEEYRTSSTVRP